LFGLSMPVAAIMPLTSAMFSYGKFPSNNSDLLSQRVISTNVSRSRLSRAPHTTILIGETLRENIDQ